MRSVLVMVLVMLVACGGHEVDPVVVRSATYHADRAAVFDAALGVMKARFHAIAANPSDGTIKTAWEHVPFAAASTPDDAGTVERGGTYRAHAVDANIVFARYDVSIADAGHGAGWHVVVAGYASVKRSGYVEPMQLRGADEPAWLGPSADRLAGELYERLAALRH